MIRTPDHWNHRGPLAISLLPLTLIWRVGGLLRSLSARPYRPPLPVICVGNLTAGGTGKTPLVGWLADRLAEKGKTPAILTMGYGGNEPGPLWVDPENHDAAACGDEPLMLADGRDVMVARDRAAGARAIVAGGRHDIIIMDDGMQNPGLARDVTIGVFDGATGIGNGWVIPAGPLRLPFESGLAELDLAVINGEDETGLAAEIAGGKVVFAATLRPQASIIESLGDAPLLAFAGIGRPARFFRTLETLGGNLAKTLSFADHHPYSQQDLTQLQEDAQRYGAEMITTQKDWMRLPPDWRPRVAMLPVTMEIEHEADFLARVSRQTDSGAADG